MAFLRSNTTKKTGALFFMALFVCVLALKALHVHELNYQKGGDARQPVNITANFFCTICEFQLAKDIDAETPFIDLATPFIFLHTYYHFQTASPVSPEKKFTVRGPPAFA